MPVGGASTSIPVPTSVQRSTVTEGRLCPSLHVYEALLRLGRRSHSVPAEGMYALLRLNVCSVLVLAMEMAKPELDHSRAKTGTYRRTLERALEARACAAHAVGTHTPSDTADMPPGAINAPPGRQCSS